MTLQVDHVYLLGLATDYCVRFSGLDARSLAFETTLIDDGCRGVEREPGGTRRAVDEMVRAGVKLTHSRALGPSGR